jgi:CheY-like chemotaxis protein
MTKVDILVVEDDKDLCDAYEIILSSAGYAVRTAENGKEALESVNDKGDPDIIFLDLRMPVMDGIEFLERYHPGEHLGTTIIVFSNYDAQKEVDEAFRLGAHRYVLKAKASPRALVKIVEGLEAEMTKSADL